MANTHAFITAIALSSSQRSRPVLRPRRARAGGFATVPTACTRVCRVCKTAYKPAENHSRACRYHPATWTGAECSKFYGRTDEHGNPPPRGIEYYYDCCDATAPDAPGCTFDFHRSYH